jgi:uncharacterized iron-regulated protein
MRILAFWQMVFIGAALAWWAPAARAQFQAVDLGAGLSPDKLAVELGKKRVVFVGETHDRYDHHLNQLEIIRRLHRLDPAYAIGVEYLEERFQPKVDDYIAGRTTEEQFLRDTDYFAEWGYDYRFYAPIFRFAREQKIPVRALNVPTALVSAVSKSGVDGVTASRREQLPQDMAPADDDYRSRLRDAFESHGSSKPHAFDHFVEAQLVWDESMSANAAAWLNADPGRRMVILAGSGHLAFGSGIPKRLERRTHASYAIVLNGGSDEDIGPGAADYILLSRKQELPPAGTLGVNLENKGEECRIRSVSPGGAGAKAGLVRGDVLLEINGQAVRKVGDVRLLLWEKKPGERVQLSASRKGKARNLEVELMEAPKDAGR